MNYKRPYELDVSWTGEPVLSPTHVGRQKRVPLWRLVNEFEFILTLGGVQSPVVIPVGFVTDAASVPWVFSWLVPKTDDTWSPALIHDVLYGAQGWGQVSKRVCDALFGLALIKQSVPAWRVAAMYESVRWGGNRAWENESPIDAFNRSEGLIPEVMLGS